jgi:hypothetical protein
LSLDYRSVNRRLPIGMRPVTQSTENALSETKNSGVCGRGLVPRHNRARDE